MAHTSRTLRSAALSAAPAVVPFVIVVAAAALSECLHATIVMQADIFSRLSRAHDAANVGFSSSCRHIALRDREREREVVRELSEMDNVMRLFVRYLNYD